VGKTCSFWSLFTTSRCNTADCPCLLVLASARARATTFGWKCPNPGSSSPAYGEITRGVDLRTDDEPPERACGRLTGHRLRNTFRDQEHLDVLLFIDNIFRFVQAGSEYRAARRMLPPLVTAKPQYEIGELQERHHIDEKRVDHFGAGDLRPRGTITLIRRRATFNALDATTNLSQQMWSAHFPAVDPLASYSQHS